MPDTTRLAVQLFTLREFTRTPAGIRSTFERLSAQGWRAVQDSAMGEISTEELGQIARDTGMQVIASHVKLDALERDPQAVIDRHAALGTRYSAVGGFFPPAEDFTEDAWNRFIDRFNAAVAKLKDADLRFGYHNHSQEWIPMGDPLTARRPIDLLFERLAPEAIFELDTYWIAHAGASPVTWIDRAAGRLPIIHLKDMLIGPGRTQVMAEVGVGSLDWPRILPACERAGVQWHIVEQDTCWRDPFDSLQTSLDNLRAMGLE